MIAEKLCFGFGFFFMDCGFCVRDFEYRSWNLKLLKIGWQTGSVFWAIDLVWQDKEMISSFLSFYGIIEFGNMLVFSLFLII